MASLKVAPRPAAKVPARMAASDFISDLDLSNEELLQLLDLAQQVKSHPARYAHSLSGRYLSLLFEKPSLRTRFTFELAIKQLGGDSVLSTGIIGDREPLKDMARNLDRWTNAIVARTFSQLGAAKPAARIQAPCGRNIKKIRQECPFPTLAVRDQHVVMTCSLCTVTCAMCWAAR